MVKCCCGKCMCCVECKMTVALRSDIFSPSCDIFSARTVKLDSAPTPNTQQPTLKPNLAYQHLMKQWSSSLKRYWYGRRISAPIFQRNLPIFVQLCSDTDKTKILRIKFPGATIESRYGRYDKNLEALKPRRVGRKDRLFWLLCVPEIGH